jgi:hypothetical protein
MKQFIKLTSLIINKNYIKAIEIHPNKYNIYMMENNINGTLLLGSGGFTSDEHKIEVCAKEKPKEYKIITDWITINSHE